MINGIFNGVDRVELDVAKIDRILTTVGAGRGAGVSIADYVPKSRVQCSKGQGRALPGGMIFFVFGGGVLVVKFCDTRCDLV